MGGVKFPTLGSHVAQQIGRPGFELPSFVRIGGRGGDAGGAGFLGVDYDPFVRTKFVRQSRYGISLSRPHWVLRLVEEDDQLRVLGFTERGWDKHQDVLVIGKPPINES